MITYIVAGNRQEYMDYYQNQRDYNKIYHYVRSAEDFIGTWRDRPDRGDQTCHSEILDRKCEIV